VRWPSHLTGFYPALISGQDRAGALGAGRPSAAVAYPYRGNRPAPDVPARRGASAEVASFGPLDQWTTGPQLRSQAPAVAAVANGPQRMAEVGVSLAYSYYTVHGEPLEPERREVDQHDGGRVNSSTRWPRRGRLEPKVAADP
jgi:hypothetical protein